MAQRLQMLYAALQATFRVIRQYGQLATRLAGLESLASWCQKTLAQFHSCVREFVRGGIHYQAAIEQVRHLETEVQQLVAEKEALQRSLGKQQQSSEHPTTMCKVCSRWITANGQSLADSMQNATCVSSLDIARVPPPPLPPPPPPPPPPLPQSVSIGRCLKMRKSLKETDHLTSAEQKKPDTRPVITAEELQKVKLRKPEERVLKALTNKNMSDYPVVKLADLQRTTLRKTQSAVVIRSNENMLPISLEAVARQKQHLKKTGVKRSPGGTPMHDGKRRRESGQGLTPMMTRALRLRFQGKTLSRSSSSETSPASSPDITKSSFHEADSSF